MGLWLWVCRHGFVVDRWWLCAMCDWFAGMVVVGMGLPAWVCGGPILAVGLRWLWVVDFASVD
uniref:Transmembrane protein n=1 Tax=Fagus sylvatica TaxID=28930 RepID=A0A2N9EQ70_FAGSY